MSNADVKEWLHHWQDEADAAYLYLALAGQETDAHKKDVYIKLAGVEERHVQMWGKLLGEHGHPVTKPHPSVNARLRAWFGRRFGTGYLLPMLLREEGEEVKSYLHLHRESSLLDAQEVSLQLAKESAAHAGTLAELAGKGSEPWHKTGSGGFLRNVVYGFNDGLTANFGLVAGVIGAAVQPHVIMISGVAGMIADALSMGSSGYLAAKSEQEVWEHEIAMEKEEIRLMPDVEQDELALLYEAKGVDPRTARRMAEEVMRDPERALGEQVREELKIGAAHATPFREGWITGVATAIGAFIPVAPFLMLEGRAAIWSAFTIAMLSHFAVGAARSFFTGRGVIRSGIDMFVIGLGVAGVGYFVGDLIAKLL
ncbi:MAG TPA: VIT1/CCC1 transporter family protein [Gemmatimonadales bacterium]|jgi:VIT1/CCC1 family predicted Fe2+/Mn2+ transporter|nr:VIT1/CCC1 transporter family protein [Gemmatimonadales bacterium]